MGLVKLKLCELNFDWTLYPRCHVDPEHVRHMCEADRAGAAFPPYIVEAGTLRVVDGFHRGRKDLREHGEDCEVVCEEREYATEKDLLLDAMRLNAAHGRCLTKIDRARCFLMAKRHRIALKMVAAALGMTLTDVKAVGEGRVAQSTTGEKIPIKRTIKHKAGEELTPEQEDANKKLSGMNQAFYARQLLILIQSSLLDDGDEELFAVLRELYDELGPLMDAA